jgi:TRAP-type mannitol/chloroaromatic compound transport system permease small subunit
MISQLGEWAERLVRLVGFIGLFLFPALIFVSVYEVVARYVFNAPTLWAFDLTFMIHGALFALTGAYGLQMKAHVRIDVLSTRLPRPVQHAANILSYLFLVIPAVWIVSDAGIRRSISAFQTNEVELVSAWSPIVWPFFVALALGMVALCLQSIVETVKHFASMFKGRSGSGTEIR